MLSHSLPKQTTCPRADWIHEIKHDGYRTMVVREQEPCGLLVGACDHLGFYLFFNEVAPVGQTEGFFLSSWISVSRNG
jgi:hypothetical protein